MNTGNGTWNVAPTTFARVPISHSVRTKPRAERKCGLPQLGEIGTRRLQRSYIIEDARLLRQKTENRYLTVLVAPWGVNRCRKALFGVISRPDTPTAVFAGETVEL